MGRKLSDKSTSNAGEAARALLRAHSSIDAKLAYTYDARLKTWRASGKRLSERERATERRYCGALSENPSQRSSVFLAPGSPRDNVLATRPGSRVASIVKQECSSAGRDLSEHAEHHEPRNEAPASYLLYDLITAGMLQIIMTDEHMQAWAVTRFSEARIYATMDEAVTQVCLGSDLVAARVSRSGQSSSSLLRALQRELSLRSELLFMVL